ncbi:molybdopterin synthase catalytic subunit [Episyrphus balteatus]|uniref:molybdopterin synthase catalytic subunit n=1 Tax=Episyrphus balteatus TaxID=286459 RepID=UPI0024865FA7|nr:molybdopterin synthase catalytic subunit [Episyrphus balteatus]
MDSSLDLIQLTPNKLDVGTISDLVADDSCGAISLFVGTTRDNFEDKKVLTLEYVAYEPMALKMMKQICDNIRNKWDDVFKIAIYHRLGLVPVKEASVVIAISSPHRQTSLDSVQFAIEELKKTVPIWKKEKYEANESAWKENKECPDVPRKLKRNRLDFDDCQVEIDQVSQNLVQISADEKEIIRRIQCFVEKKREEIDLNNIRDFTTTNTRVNDEAIKEESEEVFSCARTNGIVIKQVDSKGHLRVRRVKNRIGPQIKPDYLQQLDKLMANESGKKMRIKEEIVEQEEEEEEHTGLNNMPLGLRERLQNVENHLNMGPINPKHVFERIKAIEDKILYLESLSPEYKHFLMEKPTYVPEMPKPFKKKVFSVDEIDSLIDEVKSELEDRKDMVFG